jgi:ribonuclease R
MPRKRNHPDPYAKREKAKYNNPIVSREYLLQVLSDAYGPLTFQQIAKQLGYHDEEKLTALERRLGAMVRDAQIFRNRLSEYAIVSQADLIAGEIIGHADGFGFFRPDDGSDDIFLAPKQMRSVLHGDRALVRISGKDRKGRPEGKLVEVLDRGHQELVGHYYRESGVAFVIPHNRKIAQDVIIPEGQQGSAKHGDIVVVDLTEYPTKRSHAIGRVREVLGKDLSPSMHIEIAARNFALPRDWSEGLLAQIEMIPEEIPRTEYERRRDIRNLPLVTIDGEDARDFDDAVFCKPTENGWSLFVAIADVSWYVEPDSPLDEEAWNRGTSVYFPDRVIPMLPEKLSNGLCSINPKVDRLCMLCEMTISRKGKLIRSKYSEAVMRSHARLTYTEVASMLVDKDAKLRKQYASLVPHLEALHQLYKALARARHQRGAIDFDTLETRIRFDSDGNIAGVFPLVRNDAHKIIEECMICANIATAKFLEKHRIPGLYRVHGGPTREDLESLRAFLGELGLSLKGGDSPEPMHYAELLQSVQGQPDALVIQTVMLRSLKQAIYDSKNSGHFGLALQSYAHFTSPIRRYPDLLVHRAIRHVLHGKKRHDYRYSEVEMERAGHHCSSTERRADEASWDVLEVLKCEFMRQHVEDVFNGTIAGVTNFGLFVELDDVIISGLVHVTSLGHDYFHYDAVHHRLTGEHSRVTFKLGERMQVRVIRVNVDERKIDLEPVALPKRLSSMVRGLRKKRPSKKTRKRRG